MQKEIWKDVIGYEGRYQVSNFGTVRSLDRISYSGRKLKGKIIYHGTHPEGYKTVNLCSNGICKTIRVHRLVAQAFIPNPNNLPQVNHINEVKSDNRVENLEWITNRGNVNHSANKKSTSKYPGVFWENYSNKWRVKCRFNGINHSLGRYSDELEAAKAYQDFCKEHDLK